MPQASSHAAIQVESLLSVAARSRRTPSTSTAMRGGADERSCPSCRSAVVSHESASSSRCIPSSVVAANRPKAPESAGEPQEQLRLAEIREQIERGAEVVVLDLHAVEPLARHRSTSARQRLGERRGSALRGGVVAPRPRPTPRAARPRTRGSSPASSSARPCGGGGSCRRATGACRGRPRRPPRPPRACSRRGRRRGVRRAAAPRR